MRNRINAYVLKRKANLFNFILIDIYRFLSAVFSGARYFLKAVNSYTRKSWIMLLRFRSEVKPTFKK
jgi:hypothetical protein